jgi:hypothetical protein
VGDISAALCPRMYWAGVRSGIRGKSAAVRPTDTSGRNVPCASSEADFARPLLFVAFGVNVVLETQR